MIVKVDRLSYNVIITESTDRYIWQQVYLCFEEPDGKIFYQINGGDFSYDVKQADLLFTQYTSWRGCWDNRIYFPDDNEYDIETVFDLTEVMKCVEKISKQIITNTCESVLEEE